MSWTHPNPGEEVIADHVRQITLSAAGSSGGGQIWQLIDLNDAVNPNLSIRNQNTAGAALRVYNGTLDLLTAVNNGTNSGYVTAANLYQKGPRIYDHLAFDGDDDTEKINTALAYIRANNPLGATLRLNKNQIFLTDTINASHLDFITIEAAGGSGGTFLYASDFASETPLLDLTGSSSWTLKNIIAAGQEGDGSDPDTAGNRPSVGFLIAPSGTKSSNKGEMYGCGSVGYFTSGALYVYGGTNHSFYSCAWQQTLDGASAIVLTRDNVSSITSPNQTIITGAQTTGDLYFANCEFHNSNGSSARSTVRMRAVGPVWFNGGINDCGIANSSHVKFDDVSGAFNRNISFFGHKFYRENSNVAVASYVFDNQGTVKGLFVANPHVQAGISAIFATSASACTYQRAVLQGDITTDGFSGDVVRAGTTGTLTACHLACAGLAVNAGSSGTIDAATMLVNPGTITTVAGGDLSKKAGSAWDQHVFTVGSQNAGLTGGATKYYGPNGEGTAANTVAFPAPFPMLIRRMYVSVNGSPGAGKSFTFTLQKSGSDTAVTCTISDSAVAASDTTHLVAFTTSDTISVKAVGSATAGSATGVQISFTGIDS